MLSFSALVAGSFAMGSLAAPHIAPTALNAVRFVLAGLILSGVAAASGKVTRASLEAPWRYLVLGGLMIAYFVLMFEGLKTAAPVSMSAVFTLTPLMAAGFGWLLMRQRMTGRMALALAVGAAGALWVIFDGSLQAALRFGVGRGEAVYFVGCAAHAVYAPMVRKLNRGEPALVFTLWTNLAGMVLLLVWGWPALMATDWAALPPIVWITIAYTAIAATAATFVLLQFAALRLPSAKVMAYTYLTPSWVILWTLVLGQGVPPAMILIGVALTVVALLLLLKDE
jgi:drug/metabolite transporter (DMT)-like permease